MGRPETETKLAETEGKATICREHEQEHDCNWLSMTVTATKRSNPPTHTHVTSRHQCARHGNAPKRSIPASAHGVRNTRLADGLHHDDLELVGDLVHEGRDLLHQPVHGPLRAGLEERRDGQSGDRPGLDVWGVSCRGVEVTLVLDSGFSLRPSPDVIGAKSRQRR